VSGALAAIDAPLPAGVAGLFTTQRGGNLATHVGDDPAAVATNRSRLRDQIGAAALLTVRQAHGRGVHVVDASLDVPSGPADAIVTDQPGAALAVMVADCLPVLFADARHGVVGAAHAGRRGLAAGVLQATVGAMVTLGADPADIVAVIGPAACGACYEVPAELRSEFAATVPGAESTTSFGTPSLDLPAGAVGILAALGLGQIRRTGICTMTDDRFFSYRRDASSGRFAGVVMLARDG
jgi:YfiH family protein